MWNDEYKMAQFWHMLNDKHLHLDLVNSDFLNVYFSQLLLSDNQSSNLSSTHQVMGLFLAILTTRV